MRTQLRGIVLVMTAAVFAAACGDDGGSKTPAVTPMATETPNPTPTTDEPCPGGALTLTLRSLPGSDLDAGWTGIWHDAVAPHDTVVTADLNCAGADCTLDGSDLVGRPFGGPLPLSAGGISVCVLSVFREAVTGTADCDAGCSESSAKLSSRVFLVPDADAPCPPCIGDPTPNDGVKGGTCSGGTTPGAACDVAGTTSNDCLPAGSCVGDLDIDLNPLTTGTLAVDASVGCLSPDVPSGSCFCPNQVRPNACDPDGVCPVSGVCELGPIDRVCDADGCVDQPRPCFGTTVTRTGSCGMEQSTLVSFFCIPATRAAAINTIVGLPGPGAVALPVRQIRTPR